MPILVHQFACLSDNYGFLAHDPVSGETACIDTPDADAYLREAAGRGWTITQIWNTHWHPDHAGGNLAIKAATGCTIVAPASEGERIAGIDRALVPGDTVMLGDVSADVIDVAGHTLGHIAFHLASEGIAFVGDSLFALGCGRMFEGTPAMMWAGLERLKVLPDKTVIYCAHEYTAANARFALSVDPDNPALRDFAAEVAAKRKNDQWTVPTRLDRERAANPFLRADDPVMQARMGFAGDTVATFAAIRRAKDNF
ncbi:hydroxyacylglutathione hydrolase [Blastomonas sp.]|uniref:hydroxyacylglutathione hydrolase n=1 Tax=Blastomonas sp. TaxID=1909299 RepID=UPI0035942C1A